MSQNQTITDTKLTSADRCDRCGAQAYVRVTLVTLSQLLFCGHHARTVKPTLEPKSLNWHDETDRLAEKPLVPVSDD